MKGSKNSVPLYTTELKFKKKKPTGTPLSQWAIDGRANG
jgi:hypothetical protein